MSRAFIQKRLPFKPTDIGGCQLWLDGADSMTQVLTGSNITSTPLPSEIVFNSSFKLSYPIDMSAPLSLAIFCFSSLKNSRKSNLFNIEAFSKDFTIAMHDMWTVFLNQNNDINK